jgi:hypothetical protein
LVESSFRGYHALTLEIPDSIRTIITDGGRIEAPDGVESLEVQTSSHLDWTGNARNLRVTDTFGSTPCNFYCVDNISIAKGDIEKLYISSRKGQIRLEQSAGIASATLMLGPDASLFVSHASSLASMHLVDFTEP